MTSVNLTKWKELGLLCYLFLILFFLMIDPAFAAYSYHRAITIDHTKVSTSDQTQFPILVCANGSAPCDASVAGLNQSGAGAKVQNSNGYDIVFGTDNTCSSLLTWEMEKYTASTGEFIAWVTNTSTPLSSTVDTTFYVCYGNSAISSFQSTASAVWDSNFKLVQHLPDGSTLSLTDSTGNQTSVNHGATAVTAQINGGANFSAQYYDTGVASKTILNGIANYTISFWIKTTSTSHMSAIGSYNGTFAGIAIDINRGSSIPQSNYIFFFNRDASNNSLSAYTTSATTVNDGVQHYVVAVGQLGSNTLALYFDGSSKPITYGAAGSLGTMDTWSYTPFVGAINNQGSASTGLTGSLDEVRISTTNRSADWITTEYNNQSAPSSFYTMGAEVGGPHQNVIQGVSTIQGVSVIN